MGEGLQAEGKTLPTAAGAFRGRGRGACPRASFGLGKEVVSGRADRQTRERLRGAPRWHCLPGWESQP